MNRIILIGNGFDLAHKLKTRYQDFLDDYWRTTIKAIREWKNNEPYGNKEFALQGDFDTRFLKGESFIHLQQALKETGFQINFGKKFMEVITKNPSMKSWLDIEDEYYRLLKELYHRVKDNNLGDYSIEKLNQDLTNIKYLLSKYLKEVGRRF